MGVRAIDDYTIEINLKTKKSYFPSLMSFMSTFPIRKDLIDIYGESWIKIKNLVTLGPFEMIEKKNNSYMIFKDKSGKKIKIIINENSTSSLSLIHI